MFTKVVGILAIAALSSAAKVSQWVASWKNPLTQRPCIDSSYIRTQEVTTNKNIT